MHKKLKAEIILKGYKKEEIAKALGITYGTFLVKLRGKYKFTLDEAIRLKELLESELPIEELFS